MFNKNDDILPNVALGGCQLRISLKEVQSDLIGLGLYRPGRYRLRDPFEAIYEVSEYSIGITVDVRNGKIFRICALEGYEGKLFSNIYAGQSVSEAMKMDDRIFYHEPEGVLYFKDCPGVLLDIGDDPPAEIVPQLSIVAICVFAPEVFTPAGSLGNW